MAFRVPTPTGSVTDFVGTLTQDLSLEEINKAYSAAANGSLKGIVEYTEDPIVSSDIRQNPHSSIIDGLATMVMGGNLVNIVGWYVNEWGYSSRTVELAVFLGGKGI